MISEGSRVGRGVLMELASPQRFGEGHGPQWQAYAEALNILDGVWRDRRFRNTSFGVIGPQPSWEDTIARGSVLFELDSWARLDEDQASMIAPKHFFADGDALLGSVGRRSKDVRSFLFEQETAGDRDHIISLLKHARSMPSRSIPILGGDLLAEMCEIRGMGRSFATRLLALARPDQFVVVNNKSADWLRLATGLSLAGNGKVTVTCWSGWTDRHGTRWRSPPNPSTCGCGVFVRRCSTHSPTGRGSRNTHAAQPLAIEIPASSAARSNRDREQGPETRQGFAESYADSSIKKRGCAFIVPIGSRGRFQTFERAAVEPWYVHAQWRAGLKTPEIKGKITAVTRAPLSSDQHPLKLIIDASCRSSALQPIAPKIAINGLSAMEMAATIGRACPIYSSPDF